MSTNADVPTSESNPATDGGEKKTIAEKEKELDFANYFSTYGFLYHQKDMLTDRERMDAYRNSILQNRECFKDKVVLDVGTGSGVLAIWAAMAGARKVYAIEATSMAQNARRLVAHNGWEGVVTILEGYMEQQDLPEQVDIIISEWMGYFLLRESMLDSVVNARIKYLKPGGALYPSHAQIYIAPVCTELHARRSAEFNNEVAVWSEFGEYMKEGNGIKIDVLDDLWQKEQKEYLMQTAVWHQLQSNEVIGISCSLLEMDVAKSTLDDIKEFRSSFSSRIITAAEFTGFGGWFDVQFRGSAANPVAHEVELTTRPPCSTHWGQQVFLADGVLQVEEGDLIEGSVILTRQATNHRLLWFEVTYSISRPGEGVISPIRTIKYRID